MKHAIRRRRQVIAAASALTLAVAGLTAAGSSVVVARPVADIQPWETYINYAEPAVQADNAPGQEQLSGSKSKLSGLSRAKEFDRKHGKGNPLTANQLAKVEGKALKTNLPPSLIKKAPQAQVAKLLTILVEFNNQANDDFTGTMVPNSVFTEPRTCIPGTVQNGPLHNQIPNPASYPHKDNNSMWVPDFSPEYFNKILYTDKGLTERVRTDLTGPDGKPGINLSGYTMRNMYLEMSKGKYTVDGQATPWVKVPHSEGWYGASRCFQDAEGNWQPPAAVQSMNGHPNNPLGAGKLATDAVDTLAAMNPNFPWADYDIEDQGDRDGDGNFFEPDGVVDHLVLVHAGEDKSGGGGAEGTYAIWAHSSAVAGGYEIPGEGGLKISNYIVQPEDSGVGVFAHEYGHDLGLPDLYDTSGAGSDSDVDFWDLMSSGSHAGPIFQGTPTHMGLWDKWVLGWADPLVVEPNAKDQLVMLGQTSNTPKWTEDGIKINLPNKVITLAEPHSGSNMWYSGADQDWADVKIARSVNVPAGSDVRFWMWNNYIIEADWDYGFVEVSTDGGATWIDTKVYAEGGTEVSTPDNYPDPNGRLADFANKKYGLTGDTHGWRHDYIDLTPYAGTTVQVRLRQATDAGFLERGWFSDDFSVVADGSTVWSDDVEGGANGWTATGGTWTDTSGAGWHTDSGTQVKGQYYLAEWRNFDGFDEGLKYAYDTTYSNGPWKVEKIKYNAPGMLVWYRDTTYGNVNHVTANSTALPSYGSKGGLLIVDANFDPLRRTGDAAANDPTTLKNLPSRPQSSNAAFSTHSTYPFKECVEGIGQPFTEFCSNHAALPGKSTFTDAQGWYPGLEFRNGGLWNRDIDASVVLPSKGNAPYTTRIVNPDGSPATDLYGEDLGFTILGSGNPGDAGVAYGVKIQILFAFPGNSFAIVKVSSAKP
ncbi:immune inhibitor A domain-containing protein [Catelliglobosispora koreensis]|uniref:immune inhibitor A domain-containing protein n=1 Tax=Catelliglobosispora koreensis TaxID=129052 RepID=UPI00036780A8|nr:immune inhibitor A domain-containing protein [Catelliglobosispora koreensis]